MPIHLTRSRKQKTFVESLNDLASFCGVIRYDLDRLIRERESHYRHFFLPKKNGEKRRIDHPIGELKKLQAEVLRKLYKVYRIPNYLHGGLPKRSIFTNAKEHVGRQYVSTLDIEGFFPSFNRSQIEAALRLGDFCGPALSGIVDLVTYDDRIPQGCSTSPLLANLAFVEIERPMVKFAKRHSWGYTRFVDDIAISADEVISASLGTLCRAVEEGGFKFAEGKTHHYHSSERQVITNLVVNEKLRPTKQYIAALKAEIRDCIEHGPKLVAIANGESTSTLKGRINGRMGHLKACDPTAAAKLRNLVYGVDWKS